MRADDAALPRTALRVLLAEDNFVNQKVALRMLERLGIRADVAANGRLAVDALVQAAQSGRPYDAVLMDIQMPELDGLAATRLLRTTLAPEHQPYVIALTANAFAEDRLACLEAGADEYLPKPLDLAALAALLDARAVTLPVAAPTAHALS